MSGKSALSAPDTVCTPKPDNRYTGYSRRTVLKPRASFFAAASGVRADRRFRGSASLLHRGAGRSIDRHDRCRPAMVLVECATPLPPLVSPFFVPRPPLSFFAPRLSASLRRAPDRRHAPVHDVAECGQRGISLVVAPLAERNMTVMDET